MGTNLPPAPVRCKLTLGEGDCDFVAKTGDVVTLKIVNAVGNVDVVKATYPESDITVPATEIAFTVVEGNQELELTFRFDDVLKGQCELREVCLGNTLVTKVPAIDPERSIKICGGAR
jgi:hypothetical protein